MTNSNSITEDQSNGWTLIYCKGPEGEVEGVVQEEGGAFERRKPLQHQEERDGKTIGRFRHLLGAWLDTEGERICHRLRQPRSDIDLAPRPRRGCLEEVPGQEHGQQHGRYPVSDPDPGPGMHLRRPRALARLDAVAARNVTWRRCRQ